MAVETGFRTETSHNAISRTRRTKTSRNLIYRAYNKVKLLKKNLEARACFTLYTFKSHEVYTSF